MFSRSQHSISTQNKDIRDKKMGEVLSPPHPKLLSNGLPVSVVVSRADLLQLLHLLFTPRFLIDRRMKKVLPEKTDVFWLFCPFKLIQRRSQSFWCYTHCHLTNQSPNINTYIDI